MRAPRPPAGAAEGIPCRPAGGRREGMAPPNRFRSVRHRLGRPHGRRSRYFYPTGTGSLPGIGAVRSCLHPAAGFSQALLGTRASRPHEGEAPVTENAGGTQAFPGTFASGVLGENPIAHVHPHGRRLSAGGIRRILPASFGEVPKRSQRHRLEIGWGHYDPRGFESHPLRHMRSRLPLPRANLPFPALPGPRPPPAGPVDEA